MNKSVWQQVTRRWRRSITKVAAVLLWALVFVGQGQAVPITYTLIISQWDFGNGLTGVSPSGRLGGVSFGGTNGPVVLTFTFEGDTANVVSFAVQPTGGPLAQGYEIFSGTASVKVTDLVTGAVLAQGTFLPSAKIFVGVDNTNQGISFGSFAVTNQSDPAFPGEPVYPYGMELPSTYDLKRNFTVGPLTVGAVGLYAISCVGGFTCTSSPKALPTTSGDLYINSMSFGAGFGAAKNAFGLFTAQIHPSALLDFTGDGKADVFWRNQRTGEDYLWAVNGSVVSGVPEKTVSNIVGGVYFPNEDWRVDRIGEFNGDGKADVLWSEPQTGGAYLWLNNGDGTSFTGAAMPTVSLDWQIVGTGDFDGDGRTDVLWRNTKTGENYLWLMNGSAYSGASLGMVPDLNWQVAGVKDFNGDGKADILWYNGTTGEVYVWLMNGTSLLNAYTLNTVPDLNWKIAAVGDFSGDKRGEIVWRHQQSGEVYLWTLNAGATALASGMSLGTVSDLLWQIDGIGDLNGDGKADMLWRNDLTGENYVWYMNGSSILNEGSLNTVPDLNWRPY